MVSRDLAGVKPLLLLPRPVALLLVGARSFLALGRPDVFLVEVAQVVAVVVLAREGVLVSPAEARAVAAWELISVFGGPVDVFEVAVAVGWSGEGFAIPVAFSWPGALCRALLG